MIPFRLFIVLVLAALSVAPLDSRAQFIAYYSFEQGTGDDTGLGHDATATDATATSAGYRGQAYEFNGTSSFLDIANLDLNPDVLPQLTFGAWVLATDLSGVRQVISHDNSGLDRSLGIDWRSGVDGWSAFAGNGWIAGEPVSLGTWTFVALSLDQLAGTATLYVNDHAYTSSNAVYGLGWNFTRIGMNPSYGEYFAGKIDEVFFYNGTLNAAQLAAIRTDGLAAIPEPSTWLLSLLGLSMLAAPTLVRRYFARPRDR